MKKTLSFNLKLNFPNFILLPKIKHATSILALVVFCSFKSFAQEGNPIEFYFETDSITVEQGQSFINFLVLENLTENKVNIQNLEPVQKYPGLLLSPESSFELSKDEKKRIPVKFLANSEFMKMKAQEISFQLSNTHQGSEKLMNASFQILRDEEKQIALYSFSRENYINPAQTETSISIVAENHSYGERSIKLNFETSPDGLEIQPREMTVFLEGQEKKVLSFKVLIREKGDFFPDYNIKVRATDLIDNSSVGNTYLKLVVLSNRRQVMNGPGLEMGKNFVEAAYNQQSSGLNYLQLRGNTEFEAGKDLYARFNLSTDYYFEENQYNLYDTWLEIERKNTLLRLGNIFGNAYDYSVSGRGGMLTTGINNKNKLEIIGLDNNYNLYGTYFPESEGSKIAGAKYSFGHTKTFMGKFSYIFDHNPRLNTDTQVAHLMSSFVLDSLHQFRIEGGISHERGRINRDENTGISGSINYETQMGRWDFQSLNQISTDSYAGLNRGSFYFNENLNYNFSKRGKVFLQYQNSQVQPEYLSFQQFENVGNQFYYPYYFYSTQSLKTGVQISIANWNFLFSPQIEKQKSTNSSYRNNLTSYRFYANIGTSIKDHSIDISGEYSYSKSSDLSWFHSLNTTLSYRYQNFSINGSAKYNPNDVMDLNYYGLGNKNFFNYNIYAAYNFQTLNKNLMGAMAAGINYSELYNNTNKSINGNLEYKFSRSWAATGYGNYSKYTSTQNFGFEGMNYQLRFGIKKYFIRTTSEENHKVHLQFFYDTNFNGIFDTDELAFANEAVKLDNFIAVTDKKGRVYFQNVPPGHYTIKVNETADSRLATNQNILVDRDQKLSLGLVKRNRIHGVLKEVKQQYDELETDVRGVVIYAEDAQGNVSSTLVDQNNEFEFFLANGIYKIYIKNNKYEYADPLYTITLMNGNYTKPIIFEYKKKDTEIKVKKF